MCTLRHKPLKVGSHFSSGYDFLTNRDTSCLAGLAQAQRRTGRLQVSSSSCASLYQELVAFPRICFCKLKKRTLFRRSRGTFTSPCTYMQCSKRSKVQAMSRWREGLCFVLRSSVFPGRTIIRSILSCVRNSTFGRLYLA